MTVFGSDPTPKYATVITAYPAKGYVVAWRDGAVIRRVHLDATTIDRAAAEATEHVPAGYTIVVPSQGDPYPSPPQPVACVRCHHPEVSHTAGGSACYADDCRCDGFVCAEPVDPNPELTARMLAHLEAAVEARRRADADTIIELAVSPADGSAYLVPTEQHPHPMGWRLSAFSTPKRVIWMAEDRRPVPRPFMIYQTHDGMFLLAVCKAEVGSFATVPEAMLEAERRRYGTDTAHQPITFRQ